MKKQAGFVAVVAAALAFGGCSPADTASRNASKAADNFEVARRIRVFNGITGEVVMQMEGFCSLQGSKTPRRMAIICKDDDGKFLKNFIDRGDNTFVLTEQLSSVDASTFHYRILLRPQALIPDIDFQGDAGELLSNSNNDG